MSGWGGGFAPHPLARRLAIGHGSCMQQPLTLEQRLAGYVPSPSARRLRRRAFRTARPAACAQRIERQLDDGVRIFELDRLLYDIEVDAQRAWLQRLIAFDAYCARRDAAPLATAEPGASRGCRAACAIIQPALTAGRGAAW